MSPPKRSALITMVHDEPVFLPIWLAYYSQFFASDDIYVFDHDTTDGSTDRPGFNRIPVSHDSVDHTWMVKTIQAKQHELLEDYDVVLVTDVDEIVAPDPEWGTLGEYIDHFDQRFVNCQGYDVVHMRDREPPLDWSRPIFQQRRHWFRSYAYDKPILATEPCEWFQGFHAVKSGEYNLDERLYLLHLHRMDFDYCMERHRTRQQMRWNKKDLDGAWAAHNRVVSEPELEHWFYNETEMPNYPITIEEMPARWQRLIVDPCGGPRAGI